MNEYVSDGDKMQQDGYTVDNPPKKEDENNPKNQDTSNDKLSYLDLDREKSDRQHFGNDTDN